MNAGLVTRTAYQENPVRYAYSLTEAGRDLIPVLLALTAWGDRWATPQDGPPIRFTHDTCGNPTTPTVACSECGEPLKSDEITPSPGPGGRPAPGTALIATVLPRPAPAPAPADDSSEVHAPVDRRPKGATVR